ncbi:MAG TPA: HEAT repeat domain-containing protein [candidate division Zixibacteria bacterium]|nr:HEAT repeat domain-containing protein [candidate division Zixibacteria bacterium]
MTAPYNVLEISMRDVKITEGDLNLNLNELVHETLRELFLASKKVSIYSSEHPLSQKAIGRAFLMVEKIFRYKRYLNLHIMDGHLHALNIRIRPSIFTETFLNYMQVLDLNDILFQEGISARELSVFLDRLVKRLPSSDFSNLMVTYLKNNKIDTIMVNSETGHDIFENCPIMRGDLIGDFSVRAVVGQIIGDDFERLATLMADEELPFEEYFARYKHDYHPILISYLIPEKLAAMPATIIGEKLISAINGEGNYDTDGDVLDEMGGQSRVKELVAALNYHPEREKILDSIGEELLDKGTDKTVYKKILPEASAIKVESSERIDQFLNTTFNEALPGYDLNDFRDLFSRLLRTGQQGKVRAVINILLNYLAGPNLDLREKALMLFKYSLEVYPKNTAGYMIEYMIEKIGEYFRTGMETFEYSDLVWELAKITLAENRYDYMSRICDVLTDRRSRQKGVWSYESVAVKKAVEELNRREIIEQLVKDLVEGPHEYIPHIRNIIITIGSEEAALALSNIISHESRQVRQNVLKIMAEMGKASLTVFSQILNNNEYFERVESRRELPDEKWYVVRNSIFVLGLLNDPEACRALRVRINDSDTRVRQAIVQALEKIAGEEACDLLLVLADDEDREIRESAIIALGLVGNPDMAPELIELANNRRSDIVCLINALGKLGGSEAKNFLGNLLIDQQLQSQFTSGRSSREDLKIATIRALGRIGDKESLKKIKKFSESLSTSQKILFGGSKLSKTAEEILSRYDN